MKSESNRTPNEANADPNPSSTSDPVQSKQPKPPIRNDPLGIVNPQEEIPDVHKHQPDQQVDTSQDSVAGQINKSDRWIIRLTAVIAFTGIVGAIIFFFQLRAMKSQLRAMRESGTQTEELIKQATRQSEAAEANAKAAQEAIRVSRDSFLEDERPYIWISEMDNSPQIFSPSNQLVWSWHYMNYGKSPAYNIRFAAQMAIGKDALKQVHVLKASSRAAVLPPGKTDWSTTPSRRKGFTREEFASVLGADAGIVVFGTFNYTDAYGQPYSTTFCFYKLRAGGVAWREGRNSIK